MTSALVTPLEISVQNEVVTDHPRVCQGLITSKLILLYRPKQKSHLGEKTKRKKRGETTVSQTFKKRKTNQNTASINLKAQYINKRMILIKYKEMRCSGKLESVNLKQTRSLELGFGTLLSATSRLRCPGIPESHGAKASPGGVRESQLVMYCKVLQSYTGYIVWLWYIMWFPFSEFGM